MNPNILVLCVFSLLPEKIVSDIEVKILDKVVSSTGLDVHISTDEELRRFGQTSDNWSKAYQSGYWKSTDGICVDGIWYSYFHDPTCPALGNMFQENHKEPVRTTIKFVNATVIARASIPEIVATQDCVNSQPNASITCSFTLTAKRSNSVSTSWTKSMSMSLSSSIGIDVGVFSAGGEMQVTTGWSESTSHEETIEIGTELSATTTVPPLHNATAYLTAERGTMRVVLEYQATYDGQALLACDWGLQLTAFEDAKGLQHWFGLEDTITATQEVDIAIYSNAAINVRSTSN